MTLREKIANALEEAFATKRRNRTFILKVRINRNNDNKDVFVMTADREPINFTEPYREFDYIGFWIFKEGWKVAKESLLEQIMMKV